MKTLLPLSVLALLGFSLGACAPKPSVKSDGHSTYAIPESSMKAGGQPVLVLEQIPDPKASLPKITRVEILPGRGMNIFRMKGWLPGKGDFDLLAGPPIADSLARLTGKGEDKFGNVAFY